MVHTKYKCIERANSLIEEGTAVSLRYAALELRFCMEAITYEKLEASAKHIPPDIIDKWQPPQAVKALLEHEPKTDKGFILFAGIEEEYGVPSNNMQFVGEHKAFNLGWLRRFDYIRLSPPKAAHEKFDLKVKNVGGKLLIDHKSGGLSLFNKPDFRSGSDWWVIPKDSPLLQGLPFQKI